MTTKHEDGMRLSGCPELGSDGVGDIPPTISVAKCDDDVRCSELLVVAGSCCGLTVRLCEHGLRLRGSSRQDHAMYVAAKTAESGDDITADVKR
jgi:hypothetical protein